MNYWLWVGLLMVAVGTGVYLAGRSARRGGIVLDGSAGAGVAVGYILPPIGMLFVVVGLIEMVR